VWEPSDISSVEGNLLANARVVNEVASDLEQKRNDLVGDVENTLHVRAELTKHQREAAIKATQMDAHVQCAVLAEIPRRPTPLQTKVREIKGRRL
jgi:uncharacterized Ntn-hydrolase superfamily protein